MLLKDILKTLKINHYIKNIIVFIPLILSMKFICISQVLRAGIMFVAFCLISSAVYILNDLIDINKDKLHPIKKERPIAAGRISISLAIIILLILLIISFTLSVKLNGLCLITVLLYFILNIFYSIWLKHIAIIDIACIAFGFVLRILSGCFVISVLPSPLVILITFFISNFFTFTKRKLELKITQSNISRLSLKKMTLETINHFILISVVLSISFYITYVLDSTTIERVGTSYLFITVIPFTLIIYRLFLLIDTESSNDDPITFIEKDNVLKCLFLFYLIVFGVLLILK